MRDPGLASPKSMAGEYVTVESTAYCVALRRATQLRLTYEVSRLRDGVTSWFLVAMEEIPTVPASHAR